MSYGRRTPIVNPYRSSRCLVLLCFLSLPHFAYSANPGLLDLIEKLRADGHSIVYSSDFVNPAVKLDLASLEHATIWDLEEQLHALGLALRYERGSWFVIEGKDKSLELAVRSDNSKVPGSTTLLESLIVTGSRHRLSDRSSVEGSSHITDADMRNTPALGGDALRIITRLPGVASVGVSAKPHIRGGVQDELLIISDGVELLEPFHLADFQSIFSSLDQRTIESVDFYTGGFPARYGTRMSGVMDITPHNFFTQRSSSVGASLFSASVATQGSWDGEGSPSWQLSIRESILDHSLKRVNSKLGNPHYGDAYARMNIPMGSLSWARHADMALGFIRSEDDVTLTADERSVLSDIESYYLWSKFSATINDDARLSSVLALTLQDKQKSGRSEEPEASNGELHFNQKTEKISLTLDYASALRKGQMELGARLEYARSQYSSQADFDRGVIAQALSLPTRIQRNIALKPSGFSYAAYGSIELPITDKLWAQPGVRWDQQDYYFDGPQQHWSPRLGVRYQASSTWTVRAAAGLFYQPQGIHELQVIDGEQQFYLPERADQFIAGVTWQSRQSRFLLEAYYKDYHRQTDRFENLFNTFVLLPEIEPDRYRVRTDRALSKGLDIEFTHDWSAHGQWQLRYSFLSANERVDGFKVPRRWQQRHAVNAIARWEKNGISVSAGLSWHSGWRASEVPEELSLDETLEINQVLNNHQLGNYFAIDVSASRIWQWNEKQLELYLDISNLSNRSNAAGLEYAPQLEDGVLQFEREREVLLPLVPNIGFTFTF